MPLLKLELKLELLILLLKLELELEDSGTSMVHSVEQPSPFSPFPSSHVSSKPDCTMPSPQYSM